MQAGAEALGEMRRARRRRYVDRLDKMELLYRVYVGAIFGAIALGIVAGAIHEAPATAGAVASIRAQAPALIGLAISFGLLAGLRSGSRGGPLAIEEAELRYVLLAPLDRGVALRPAAIAQARIAAIVGAVTGAIVGNFVFRRFPGTALEWIGCLALFGALAPLCVLGAAQLACGRRLRTRTASALGLLLVAWSVADVALGWTSSPATLLGELATLPLRGDGSLGPAAVGVGLALALAAAGLLGIGGLLLEAARRRATLTAEMRFSASVQDLRTVILLRRQLASELPRRRPWLRLSPGGKAGHPVWRRGWQSFLRWPAARVARVAALGVAAGAVAVAGWSQTPVLFALPGLLLFVAALDLIEPLAQEADHPTRRGLLPLAAGRLFRHHLVAPASALAGVLVLGSAAAAAIGSDPATALGLGAAMLLASPLLLACAAGLSATNDPYEFVLTPQLGYVWSTLPVGLAAAGVGVPLLLAWSVDRHGGSPVGVAVAVEIAVLLLSAGLVALLQFQATKGDEVAA
jgi:hypothetical protein